MREVRQQVQSISLELGCGSYPANFTWLGAVQTLPLVLPIVSYFSDKCYIKSNTIDGGMMNNLNVNAISSERSVSSSAAQSNDATRLGERKVFMVAGGGAVSYAAGAVRSLICNSADPIKLTILTDSDADKAAYEAMASEIDAADVKVVSEGRCDQLAEEFYRPFPNIRTFRKGHPCWRKITDPSLFVESGQEVIVVDPDLYFPNIFRFEATLPGQLILMRQHRHCLLPPSVVERAFEKNIALAHHTDIGVAHHTVLPWEWLENLIAELGGADLPRVAHIESIIWAAIAMQIGGGYLRASDWLCWERTVPKRALLMLGIRGPSLFRLEPLKSVKCFHASSGAKDWLLSAEQRGIFRTGKVDRTSPSPLSPFVSISAEEFKRGERMKGTYHSLLRGLGLKDPLH